MNYTDQNGNEYYDGARVKWQVGTYNYDGPPVIKEFTGTLHVILTYSVHIDGSNQRFLWRPGDLHQLEIIQ